MFVTFYIISYKLTSGHSEFKINDNMSLFGTSGIRKLADAELVGAHRLRQVIAEENPTLIAYDQDAWVRNLDYDRRKPKQSLESFRRLRAENYELLKGLPESAFERAGKHTENGRMTLLTLVA